MKRNRLLFYTVFAVFHVCAFIFTAVIDNNTSLLFKMVQYVPWFKYATLLGLILLVIDFIWALRTSKESEKEKSLLNHELNTLKAKLFDLQEAGKTSSTPKV